MNKLERNKIILEVVTPFFIGNGDEYLDIDYVYDKDRIKIIDKNKFNKRVFKDEKLYNNLLSISDDFKKLKSFFKNNAKEFLYDVRISNKVNKLISNEMINIKKFVRDKFTQTPIIPGSTIKGIIRTSLANYYYHNNRKLHEELQNENSEVKFLNAIFRNYEKDAKKDILKSLYVSDLKPIDCEMKIIRPFYKINIEDEPNDLDVLEVLTKGKFEGEIIINKNFKDINIDLSIDIIKSSLEEFFKKILNYEKERIKNKEYKFPEYQPYLIKLGLHSGAGAKTIEGKRRIKVKLKNEKKPKILNYQLSTWFDEDKNALGWAKLEFKDIKWTIF